MTMTEVRVRKKYRITQKVYSVEYVCLPGVICRHLYLHLILVSNLPSSDFSESLQGIV